jgi:uncharacterized protein (DUF983 family)
MLWELVCILLRGLKLRCPCCGHGRLFKLALQMHVRCSSCDEVFDREPGQRFGAIYINLGLTLGLAATGFVATEAFTILPVLQQLTIWIPIAALGPFMFYRRSK